MTQALFTSLCVSATLLILLVSVKRYEMYTGRVVFAGMRPVVYKALHPVVLFVQYILPFLAKRSFSLTMQAVRVGLSRTVARIVLYLEILLARMLSSIQNMMQPKRGGGQASSFLQEVADHKRKLLKDPAEKHAIFEEYH